ncbi:hypothetical protein CPB97_003439 [Podila verticillata]|nr:hypothetical protein CPB97_003439 [Podila verticillata]
MAGQVEQEPIWCLSTLDKTQRSILGQAWLVHKSVPPPDTMEWMAKLIDSDYKIVRYWFHCHVNFEGINKAMQANPDAGVLMPGIDNWYELEYITHPPTSPALAKAGSSSLRVRSTAASQCKSSRKAMSTSITGQQTKQTTKLNKPVTSKRRASHFRAPKESSDDMSSDNNPDLDPKDKSVVRGRGTPSAPKKRHFLSAVDQCETQSRKYARLVTPTLSVC